MNHTDGGGATPAPHGPPSAQPSDTQATSSVPASTPPDQGGKLPTTGPDVVWLVIIAAALLLVGAAMVGAFRRRRAGENA